MTGVLAGSERQVITTCQLDDYFENEISMAHDAQMEERSIDDFHFQSEIWGVPVNCGWSQRFLVGLGLDASANCAPGAGWFLPGFAEDRTDPGYEVKTGSLLRSQSIYLPPECITGMGKANLGVFEGSRAVSLRAEAGFCRSERVRHV